MLKVISDIHTLVRDIFQNLLDFGILLSEISSKVSGQEIAVKRVVARRMLGGIDNKTFNKLGLTGHRLRNTTLVLYLVDDLREALIGEGEGGEGEVDIELLDQRDQHVMELAAKIMSKKKAS